MFEMFAEGQFMYNGTDVQINKSDGNWEKTFWGSTLSVTERAVGDSRYFSEPGGYKYAEVYTRVYLESNFLFEWFGIVMDSGTIEVYVGGTPYGGTYGSAKTL